MAKLFLQILLTFHFFNLPAKTFIIHFFTYLFYCISQSRHKEKDTLDYVISQFRTVYNLLRRDSYYKKKKRRKEKEYEQRIIDAVQQRQFYNRVQSRNNKFNKNYRQQPYGNRPLNDKKSARRAGKFNKKGAKALKCYTTPTISLTKVILCANFSNN